MSKKNIEKNIVLKRLHIVLKKYFQSYFKKLRIDTLTKFDRNSGKIHEGNRTNLDNIRTLTHPRVGNCKLVESSRKRIRCKCIQAWLLNLKVQ